MAHYPKVFISGSGGSRTIRSIGTDSVLEINDKSKILVCNNEDFSLSLDNGIGSPGDEFIIINKDNINTPGIGILGNLVHIYFGENDLILGDYIPIPMGTILKLYCIDNNVYIAELSDIGTVGPEGPPGPTGPTGSQGPIPCEEDYTVLKSYSTWISGKYAFGPSTNESKFEAIANEYDTSDYLTLELVGGQSNGFGISKCAYSSITVDYTNLTYRDDGYGLAPSNYIDYINSIFSGQSLYTRISGAPDSGLYANFCALDNFVFIFKETGQIAGGSGLSSPFYYALTSRYGTFLGDSYAGSLNAISSELNQGFIMAWSVPV
jgi:hypothetical protein